MGSTKLEFRPHGIRAGKFDFAVGTAGSCTLVLQAVLPALLVAPGPSLVTLEGGTHNPMAPPFDFLAETFLPQVRRMGARVSARLERHGFYPAGGGVFTADVDPVKRLAPIELVERGPLVSRRAVAVVSQLPHHVGRREVECVREHLGWGDSETRVETVRDSRGPGNMLLARLEHTHVTEVASAVGEKGRPAEKVAEDLVAQVKAYLAHGAPVGEHLADQLLLPMAMAGEGVYRTGALTSHARTQMELVPRFLGVRIVARDSEDGQVEVRVLP